MLGTVTLCSSEEVTSDEVGAEAVSEGAAAEDATWELGASDVPVSCCLFLSLSTSSTFPLRVRGTAAASQRHMRTTNATLGFIFFSVWSCHFVEKEDKNGGRGDRVARRKGRQEGE